MFLLTGLKFHLGEGKAVSKLPLTGDTGPGMQSLFGPVALLICF